MFRLPVLCRLTLVLGGLCLASALSAQEDSAKSKAVEFYSADRVKLKGTFYAGTRGKDGPTVILLHAIGEDSSKKEWQNLAKRLQGAGYSVLAFDFRGHGQSTLVDPGTPNTNPKLRVAGFWDEDENRRGVKDYKPVAKKRPTEIDQKQFTQGYQRILVNDIAAAVSHLEESGDAGTQNLVLIGANDAATLGAVWINSEWHRYKLLPPQPGYPRGKPDLQNPEGARIRAAVWLSMGDKIGSQSVNVPSTLDFAARQKHVPMAFFYGDGDDKAKKIATACEKQLKKKDDKNQEFLGAVKIKDAEKLSGRSLLVESLGTEKAIVDYLKSALDGRLAQPAKSAKTDDYPHVWQYQSRTGQVVQRPAKPRGASTVLFSTYEGFLR